MNEVEMVVYKRLVGDTASGGILDLLGDSLSAPARVLHAMQNITPEAPSVVFRIYAAPVGHLVRFTREVFIMFSIYSDKYADVALRLIRLFDGIQHDLSVIAGGSTQIGGLSSVFDFEGPDGFDESLGVQQKDMRFRFFTVSKAQTPI